MSRVPTPGLWKSPAGERFIDYAFSQASNGDCALVVPDIARQRLTYGIMEAAKERGVVCSFIKKDMPRAEFDACFNGSGGSYESMPKEGRLLVVEVDRNSRKFYKDFVGGKPDGTAWNMLCVCDPEISLPRHFARKVWWGQMGKADVLASAEPYLNRKVGYPALAWYMSLCYALCWLDYSLMEDIPGAQLADSKSVAEWTLAKRTFEDDVVRAMREHRKTESCIHNPRMPPKPDSHTYSLWLNGALDCDIGGVEIAHPSILLQSGDVQGFAELLAAGQSEVYMPLVSVAHNAICRRLERRFGLEWDAGKPSLSPRDDRGYPKKEVLPWAHRREISALYNWLKDYHWSDCAFEMKMAGVWGDIRNGVSHMAGIDAESCSLALNGVAMLCEMGRE